MNNQAGIHSGTKRPIPLLVFYSQFMNLMEKCFALNLIMTKQVLQIFVRVTTAMLLKFCRDWMPIGWITTYYYNMYHFLFIWIFNQNLSVQWLCGPIPLLDTETPLTQPAGKLLH